MSFIWLSTAVLFGIGFGFFVQRAGLCFAHGLAEHFMGKGRRILRLFLVIFVVSSLCFWLSGFINPELGLKPIGQIRGYGFFNVLSGIFFGAGIMINGGCILGTLRQIGEGNMLFLIVLVSFIPGMALIVYGIDPLISEGYDVSFKLLNDLFCVPSGYIAVTLAVLGIMLLYRIKRHS